LAEATVNTKVPEKLKEKWARQVKNFANYRRGSQKPLPRENKAKIITWGVFWPFSMLWSIVDEPWRYIYDLISGWLHGISDFIYKRAGYDEDMEVPEKKKRGKSKEELDKEELEFPGLDGGEGGF